MPGELVDDGVDAACAIDQLQDLDRGIVRQQQALGPEHDPAAARLVMPELHMRRDAQAEAAIDQDALRRGGTHWPLPPRVGTKAPGATSRGST